MCANSKRAGENKLGNYDFEAFDADGKPHIKGAIIHIRIPDLQLSLRRHDSPQGCRWLWEEYSDESAFLLVIACQPLLEKFKHDLANKIKKAQRGGREPPLL